MILHPAANLFPLLEPEELAKLTADIAARGLLEPIELDSRGQLVDGRNRLAACTSLSITPRTVSLSPATDPWRHVLSKNLHRRHLTTAQRLVVLKGLPSHIIQQIEAEAAGRRQEGGKKAGRGRPAPKNSSGRARPKLSSAQAKGELVGVSATTVKDFERLEKDAPEEAEKVLAGKQTLGAATKQVARKSKKSKPMPAQLIRDRLVNGFVALARETADALQNLKNYRRDLSADQAARITEALSEVSRVVHEWEKI